MTEGIPTSSVRLPLLLCLAACGGFAASMAWARLQERRRLSFDAARTQIADIETSEPSRDGLDELLRRNKRFASGELGGYLLCLAPKVSVGRRATLSRGQQPFAVVVCCADSRVSPELIFDSGLGELFVVRTAGNLVDDIALGSIEYAVEHLHVKLLLILGHRNCGAVQAAMSAASGEEEHGHDYHPHQDDNHPAGAGTHHIPHLIAKITPAVHRATALAAKEAENGSDPLDKNQLLDLAVQENVLATRDEVLSRSFIIQAFAKDKKLAVSSAVYCLNTGVVTVLDQ